MSDEPKDGWDADGAPIPFDPSKPSDIQKADDGAPKAEVEIQPGESLFDALIRAEAVEVPEQKATTVKEYDPTCFGCVMDFLVTAGKAGYKALPEPQVREMIEFTIQSVAEEIAAEVFDWKEAPVHAKLELASIIKKSADVVRQAYLAGSHKANELEGTSGVNFTRAVEKGAQPKDPPSLHQRLVPKKKGNTGLN